MGTQRRYERGAAPVAVFITAAAWVCIVCMTLAGGLMVFDD